MVDFAQALWMPNNNYFANREGQKARFIILHGTASEPGESAQGIANFFANTQNGNNPVSSHYIVGKDGTVVQCVAESNGAWANGALSNGHDPWWSNAINPNNLTISIEHIKWTDDNSDALAPAQQLASFALVADICKRQNIPARTADSAGGITGHFSIDPVNRSRCPGTYDWNALWAYLKGSTIGGGQMVPTGWTDANSVLTAPNKVNVVLGFRDYVLANNWDAGNWPLEPESHHDPLEESNPLLGAGQRQIFRWKTLEYTPHAGVFEAWPGQELLYVLADRDKLRAQIATLQGQIVQSVQDALVKDLRSRLGQINTLSKVDA